MPTPAGSAAAPEGVPDAPERSWRLGLAFSLVTVLFWGMLPIGLKGLLRELDSWTITWARFTVAALVVAGWLALRGRLPALGRLRGGPGVLALVASAGLCGNYVVYLYGLDRVTPATAQTVVQLAPMSLLLGSLLVFGERLSRVQVGGLATFFLGLAMFFERKLPAVLAGLDTRSTGVALVAAAAVLWGIYGLAQKALLRHLRAAGILLVVYGFGAVVLLPGADVARIPGLSPVGWALLAFCCANTLIAYGSFAEALERWEASRVSAVLAATPLATACFAEVAARVAPGMVPTETWTPVGLLGAFLVATGCGIAALGKEAPAARRRRPGGRRGSAPSATPATAFAIRIGSWGRRRGLARSFLCIRCRALHAGRRDRRSS